MNRARLLASCTLSLALTYLCIAQVGKGDLASQLRISGDATRSITTLWNVTSSRREISYTPSQIDKARSQFRQQLIAQGMPEDKLDGEVENFLKSMVNSGHAQARHMSVTAWRSGDRFEVQMKESPEAPIVTEFWDGKDNTRFFDPDAGQVGAVGRDTANPFQYTGRSKTDPAFLLDYPLTSIVPNWTRKSGSGNISTYTAPVANGKEMEYRASIDERKHCLSEFEIYTKRLKLPLLKFTVRSYQAFEGTWLPREFAIDVIDQAGQLFSQDVYSLKSVANLPDASEVEAMGLKGHKVVDSRLGPSNPRSYTFADHLYNVDELQAVSQPHQVAAVKKSEGPLKALMFTVLAIVCGIAALGIWKVNKQR